MNRNHKKNKNNNEKNIKQSFDKKWWSRLQNRDEKMSKYLWNNDINPITYSQTDFDKQNLADRDLLLHSVIFMSKQRTNTTTQFLTLNSIFLSVYAYGISHTDWFLHTIMIITFFVISISICMVWIAKIKSCLYFNNACFSAIRLYQQKSSPSKPHGDAILKFLHEPKKDSFRPLYDIEIWVPRLFMILYLLLFIYNMYKLFL